MPTFYAGKFMGPFGQMASFVLNTPSKWHFSLYFISWNCWMIDCCFLCHIYQIILVSDKFLRNYLLCYCQLTSVPMLPDGQLVHGMCKIGRQFLSNISIICHMSLCDNWLPKFLAGKIMGLFGLLASFVTNTPRKWNFSMLSIS